MEGPELIALTARLVERSIIRYSPAGVPVLECRLKHRSTQWEAQAPRAVEFEMKALALGSVVADVEVLEPGAEVAVRGFLAPTRKGSRTLLLHITGIEPVLNPDQVDDRPGRS